MSCFEGLVGLKNTCLSNTDLLAMSSSGLWLQNLTGFPGIKIADASINEEYKTGIDLIRQSLDNAIKELSIQFRTHLSNKLQHDSIVENETVGFFNKDRKIKPAQTNYWRGIRVELKNKSHFELFISTVSLLLNSVEVVDLKIFDLTNGLELKSIAITTIQGVPVTVQTNESFFKDGQRLDLFIGYLSIESSLNTTITGCHSCKRVDHVRITAAKILNSVPKTTANIESASDTGGLSINYSLSCTVDAFLCQSKNLFAWALLHKWGSNVMSEAVYSRRLNSLINLDSELNKALGQDYENIYMASMSAVLNNTTLPNDICFKCKPPVRNVVRVP